LKLYGPSGRSAPPQRQLRRELRWQKLNIQKITPFGGWAEGVDLSKVDEIGFTDLMPGGGHGTHAGKSVIVYLCTAISVTTPQTN
jgi:hypothetical protein